MRRSFLNRQTANREEGFTIIELLIAITIFSIILLAIIFALVLFFTTYYKASLSSTTQNEVQNISNAVEQAIKFGVTTPIAPTAQSGATPGYFCAGNEEFLFFLGQQQPSQLLGGNKSALYEIPTPVGGCGVASESGGISLLGSNYRIITLNLSNLTGVGYVNDWVFDIKIAYTTGGAGSGNDLLCDPSVNPSNATGGCAQSAPDLTNFTIPDIICKTKVGSQFCDVSELKSLVEWRL